MQGRGITRFLACVRKAHQQMTLKSSFLPGRHDLKTCLCGSSGLQSNWAGNCVQRSGRRHFYCTDRQNYAAVTSLEEFVISSSDIGSDQSDYASRDGSSSVTSIQSPSVETLPAPPKGKINKIQNGEVVTVKPEELYTDIKYMNSADLLDTFATSYRTMDKVHYAVCLKRLATIYHKLWGRQQTEFQQATYTDERFQVLCALITRKSRYYRPSVAFDMFIFLRSFGFHDNHPAVETFLQLLKHHVNELHADQLIDLAEAARGMVPTKNTNLILGAISVLLPHRTNEFGALSLSHRMVLLDLFTDVLTDKWQNVLWRQIREELKGSELDHDQAPVLLRIMNKISVTDPNVEDLCVASLEQNLHEYEIQELLEIVRSLHSLSLYYHDLLNDIAAKFMGDTSDQSPSDRNVSIPTLRDQLDLLECFCDQSHSHPDLMDSVLHGTVDSDCSPVDVRDAVETLAALGAEPLSENLAAAISQKVRESWTEPHDPDSHLDLMSSVLALGLSAPLGVREEQEVSQISAPLSHGEGEGEGGGGMARREYAQYRPGGHGGYAVTHSQAVAVLRSHGAPVEIPAADREAEIVNRANFERGLGLFLKKAFPEAQIDDCCILESGLTVDYVMQDLSTDLQVPQTTRVAVKVLPPVAFTRNHQTLKGFPRLYTTALQKLGYTVIVICPMNWSATPDRERPEYLRHRILNIVKQGTGGIHIL